MGRPGAGNPKHDVARQPSRQTPTALTAIQKMKFALNARATGVTR